MRKKALQDPKVREILILLATDPLRKVVSSDGSPLPTPETFADIPRQYDLIRRIIEFNNDNDKSLINPVLLSDADKSQKALASFYEHVTGKKWVKKPINRYEDTFSKNLSVVKLHFFQLNGMYKQIEKQFWEKGDDVASGEGNEVSFQGVQTYIDGKVIELDRLYEKIKQYQLSNFPAENEGILFEKASPRQLLKAVVKLIDTKISDIKLHRGDAGKAQLTGELNRKKAVLLKAEEEQTALSTSKSGVSKQIEDCKTSLCKMLTRQLQGKQTLLQSFQQTKQKNQESDSNEQSISEKIALHQSTLSVVQTQKAKIQDFIGRYDQITQSQIDNQKKQDEREEKKTENLESIKSEEQALEELQTQIQKITLQMSKLAELQGNIKKIVDKSEVKFKKFFGTDLYEVLQNVNDRPEQIPFKKMQDICARLSSRIAEEPVFKLAINKAELEAQKKRIMNLGNLNIRKKYANGTSQIEDKLRSLTDSISYKKSLIELNAHLVEYLEIMFGEQPDDANLLTQHVKLLIEKGEIEQSIRELRATNKAEYSKVKENSSAEIFQQESKKLCRDIKLVVKQEKGSETLTDNAGLEQMKIFLDNKLKVLSDSESSANDGLREAEEKQRAIQLQQEEKAQKISALEARIASIQQARLKLSLPSEELTEDFFSAAIFESQKAKETIQNLKSAKQSLSDAETEEKKKTQEVESLNKEVAQLEAEIESLEALGTLVEQRKKLTELEFSTEELAEDMPLHDVFAKKIADLEKVLEIHPIAELQQQLVTLKEKIQQIDFPAKHALAYGFKDLLAKEELPYSSEQIGEVDRKNILEKTQAGFENKIKDWKKSVLEKCEALVNHNKKLDNQADKKADNRYSWFIKESKTDDLITKKYTAACGVKTAAEVGINAYKKAASEFSVLEKVEYLTKKDSSDSINKSFGEGKRIFKESLKEAEKILGKNARSLELLGGIRTFFLSFVPVINIGLLSTGIRNLVKSTTSITEAKEINTAFDQAPLMC